MKKIKCLAIVGLLLCGIICNSVPSFASTNADEGWKDKIDWDYVADGNNFDLSAGDDVNLSSEEGASPTLENFALDSDDTSLVYATSEDGTVILDDPNLTVYPNSDMKITGVSVEKVNLDTNNNIMLMSEEEVSNNLIGSSGLTVMDTDSIIRPEKSEYFEITEIVSDQIKNNIINYATTATAYPDLEVSFWVKKEIDKYYDPINKAFPARVVIPCYLEIANIGDVVCPRVHLDPLTANSKPIGSGTTADYYNLQPGKSLVGDIPIGGILIGAGTHTILQSVNNTIAANDQNWDNNIAGFIIKLVDQPDIVSEYIKLENDANSFRACETVIFETLFYNYGKKQSGKVNLKVKAGNDVIFEYRSEKGFNQYEGLNITFYALFHEHSDSTKIISTLTCVGDFKQDDNQSSCIVNIDYAEHLHNAKWSDSKNITVGVGPNAMIFLTEGLDMSESDVLRAFTNWNKISSNVKITAYTTNSNYFDAADITVHLADQEPNPTTGVTRLAFCTSYRNEPYFNSGEVQIYVNINDAAHSTMKNWTNKRKIATLSHEMGHALGLAHCFDEWDIVNDDPTKTEDDNCFDKALMFRWNSDPQRTTEIVEHDKKNLIYKYGK